MWQELLGVMQKISAAYTQLVKLQEDKRKALGLLKVQTVADIVSKEEALLKQVEEAENRRKALVTELLQNAGPRASQMRLQELLQLCKNPTLRQALETERGRIDKLLKQSQDLADANGTLARGALLAIRHRLEKIGPSVAPTTYGMGGSSKQGLDKRFDYHA